MAQYLALKLASVKGVTVVRPPQANAVFATLSPDAIEALQKRWRFYVWDESTHLVRWMTHWSHKRSDIDAFVADIEAALK